MRAWQGRSSWCGPGAALWLTAILTLVLAAAAPAAAAPAPEAVASAVSHALVCHGNGAVLQRTPALLVPDIDPASAGAAHRLATSLADQGHTTCVLTWPEPSQRPGAEVLGQYVAYAVRGMAQVHGGAVNAVAHRDGAALLVGALRQWPETAGLVQDAVLVSPSGRGLTALPCATCTGFARALTVSPVDEWVAQFPAGYPQGPSFTVVAGVADPVDLVHNQGAAHPGAAVVKVNEVCGAATPLDADLTASAVTSLVVVDAFTHEGGAVAARLPAGACAAPPGRG